MPPFVGDASAYSFPLRDGRVWIDHSSCDGTTAALVLEHASGLLRLDDRGRPVLAVSEEDVADRDSELIACEIECARAGRPVVFVDLPIAGLDEAGSRRAVAGSRG